MNDSNQQQVRGSCIGHGLGQMGSTPSPVIKEQYEALLQQKQEDHDRWERMTLGDALREREDQMHKELARLEGLRSRLPVALLALQRKDWRDLNCVF